MSQPRLTLATCCTLLSLWLGGGLSPVSAVEKGSLGKCGHTWTFVSYQAKIQSRRVWASSGGGVEPSAFIYAQVNFTKDFFTMEFQNPTQDQNVVCMFYCSGSTVPSADVDNAYAYVTIERAEVIDGEESLGNFTCPDDEESDAFHAMLPLQACNLVNTTMKSAPLGNPEATWGRSLTFYDNAALEPPCKILPTPTAAPANPGAGNSMLFTCGGVRRPEKMNDTLCVTWEVQLRAVSGYCKNRSEKHYPLTCLVQNPPYVGSPPFFSRLGFYVFLLIAVGFIGGFIFLFCSSFEGDQVSLL